MTNIKQVKNLIKNITLLVVLFVVLINTKGFSFSGWNLVDGEYVYLNEDGKQLCNVFKESNGEMYFLGEDGYMVKNSLVWYSGDVYYLDGEGKMAKNICVIVNEDSNQNREFADGVYSFNEIGRAYRRYGEKDFRKRINGVYYAVDENGKILVGWLDENGHLLEDEADIFSEGYYYANGDGVLISNTWYDFSDDIGSYTDRLEASNMVSEQYDYMDRLWMYFDNGCKKIKATGEKIKKKEINGRAYSFDENGIMLQGFTKNGDLDLSQGSNPSLVENVKLYDTTNGDLIKGKWIKTKPSKLMSEEDYSDDKESWFYARENGNVIKNALKTIDGYKYAFDGIGRMKKGIIMAAENTFKAQYDTDDLTRNDFIFPVTDGGLLFGSDLCEMYYFCENEEEEGKMMTGEFEIKLDDGTYTFKFKETNGKAIGSHTKLTKSKDKYYINGLRLSAWDGYRYGVLKVSDTEYKVLNHKGNEVKGKRKIVKDDEGNYLVIISDNLVGYIRDQGDIKIKWKKAEGSEEAGYYLYDTDKKEYVSLAVSGSATIPTSDQLDSIPDVMKINYE